LTAQTKPVRIVFAAGGGSDFLPRVSGQRLSERFGQQFVIESRTGAGSNIAAEAVVNAPPAAALRRTLVAPCRTSPREDI